MEQALVEPMSGAPNGQDAAHLLACYPGAIAVVANDMTPLFLNEQAREVARDLQLDDATFARKLLQRHLRIIKSVERNQPATSRVLVQGPGNEQDLAVVGNYTNVWEQDAHCLFFEVMPKAVPGSGWADTEANYDEMTRLLCPHGLKQACEFHLHQQHAAGKRFTCFFIRINGLANVNESCGRQEGDRSIQRCARLLGQYFEASDLVARSSGGEFVVVSRRDKDSICQSYKDFLAGVRDYNRNYPSTISLSVSVGVATGRCSGWPDIQQLVTSASSVLFDSRGEEFVAHSCPSAGMELFSRA